MTKTLKVYRGSAAVSKNYRDSVYRTFPELKLRGDWLKELGFYPGMEYEIAATDGRLVLTVKQPN